MAGQPTQGNLLTCPHCRAENYLFATFCIACGEPFDEIGDPNLPFRASQSSATATAPLTTRTSSHTRVYAGALAALQRIPTPPLTTYSKFARRETVFGILVLILAVSYAVYDWQRTAAQSAAYQEGIAYEQNKNWDKAAIAFEQAGDHKDADSKAHHARFEVAERNRLYVQGITASEQEDWKTAMTAFAQLQGIQPGFAGSADKLVEASSRAFKLELGGLVYQMSEGSAAGLYMIDSAGKPNLLPGSDKNSTIHATSPGASSFVYDRPPGTLTAASTGSIDIDNVGSAVSPHRISILAAVISGTVKTRPLPALNSDGAGVFAGSGLWWYSGWYSSPENTGYSQYEIYYNDNRSNPPSAALISRAFGKQRVIAFDPSRSRVIVAETPDSHQGPAKETRLYLADAAVQNKLPLELMQGDVTSASFSRDGKWLLVLAQDETSRLVQVLSLDSVDKNDANQVTACVLTKQERYPPDSKTRLTASFVPADKSPPQVIVDRIDSDIEHLTLYSVYGEATEIWHGDPNTPHEGDLAGFSNTGGYLASRQQWDLHDAAMLELVRLSRPDFILWFNVPMPAHANELVKVQFAPHDNYIAAIVQGHNDTLGGLDQTIYAARLDGEGGLGQMKRIASGFAPYGRVLPSVALAPGGSLIAYVNARRELHAVSYDGKLDTLLAYGVGGVWSLGDKADLSWAR